MSTARRLISSPEIVTPKPLSSDIGETVTLLKMTLLSLTHAGRAPIGELAERIIAPALVNVFSLDEKCKFK